MTARLLALILLSSMVFSCENKPAEPKIVRPADRLPADSLPKLVEKWAAPEPHDSTVAHIYFTVDDGPSAFSGEILKMAEEEGVPMTAFIVGYNCYTDERAEFVNAYHASPLVEVGNHSFCHAHNDYDNWYLDPEQVWLDFQKNEKLMLITNRLARLPGRAIWEVGSREKCIFPTGRSSGQLLAKHGYRVFGWDVEWHYDHRTGLPKESPEQVLESIERHLRDGEVFTPGHVVLLLHERHFQAKEEVRRLIRLLKSGGFAFSFLGNYPVEA